MTEQSYRSSHVDKGQDYQDIFVERRDLAMAWAVERRLLDELVLRRFGDRPFRYLDFACGTGRILAHMERHATESVGVDVSRSMIACARPWLERATVIRGDLTRDPVLGDRRFDLITAFRFFPNAEPELRHEAMAALVRHLAPGGVIVFNNHQNSVALRRRLLRVAGRDPGHEMRPAEVGELLDGVGLEVQAVHGVGLLPFSHRFMPLPVGLLTDLEHRLADTPLSRRLATSLLFECGRRAS